MTIKKKLASAVALVSLAVALGFAIGQPTQSGPTSMLAEPENGKLNVGS